MAQQLLKSIVYGNFVVALSGGFLSAAFTKFVAIPSFLEYGLFTFFAILGMYNFHRISKSKEFVNEDLRLWYNHNKKKISVLTDFSFVIALIISLLLIKNYQSVLMLFAPVLIISIWYVVPFFKMRLRDIPFLKAPLVALSWTIVLIAFPLINEYNLTVNDYYRILAFTVYFLALTIPFDIRDKKADIKNQRTLPQLLGNASSKVVALLLLLGFYAIFAIIYEELRFSILFLFSLLITATLILLSNERRSYAFFALVDLSMILIAIPFFYK